MIERLGKVDREIQLDMWTAGAAGGLEGSRQGDSCARAVGEEVSTLRSRAERQSAFLREYSMKEHP